MKRIFLLFILSILFLNLYNLLGCNSNNTNGLNTPNTHTCEATDNIVYREQDGILSIGFPCKTCNKICETQEELEADFIINTTDYDIDSILSNVKPEDIIVFKNGKHSSQFTAQLTNVKIFGETGTILYGLNNGNLTNVKIENIEFESATELKKNIDGLTFTNCKFSYGILCEFLIKNISFESCKFIDITSSRETAIKLVNYENLSVKNCYFDNIAYNALQVGVTANGHCNIYGNTFKNIKSRVIYLISVDTLTECNIVNNIFYDHHENYINDESLDISGCKKNSGVYIHSKSSHGLINIGINTWENLPDFNVKYIVPIANYYFNEQLKLI